MDRLHEALRRNQERATSNFLPLFKFPEGKTDIRILPAAKADERDEWFLPVGLHYNVEEKRPVFCRAETNWAEETCPVCDMVRELRQDGLNDEAQKISVRRQYIVRAIVRTEEEKGAQSVRLPSTLFTQIGTFVADEDAFGNLLHPGGKGRDIRVTKTGTMLNTKYASAVLPNQRWAMDDHDKLKEVIKELTSITDLVSVLDEEELTRIVKDRLGFTASDMGDGAEDADLLNTDDDDDDFDFTVSDDDDDVPFKTEKEEEKEEESTEVASDDDDDDDDSWLDDDEDEIMDVTGMVNADRAKDDGEKLTEDLAEALEEEEPPKKKKAQTRRKKKTTTK